MMHELKQLIKTRKNKDEKSNEIAAPERGHEVDK